MDMHDTFNIDGIYKLESESKVLLQMRFEEFQGASSDIFEILQFKLDYYIERIVNGDIQSLMPNYHINGYQIDFHFFKEIPAGVDKYLREKADEVRDKQISMTVSVAFE
ncbi:hypothetical protein [Trichococcus ilyis]|jgi:hypothetical protein|uniref:Uncharacterized protein n=1 Tax=Trichococcus ilyis TaxID=640938 RepID=A0A143YML3_9LACT|nr:hypothetical protein [Trichococcus ilyis]CZQ93913.1 Hypothetical protein TR210_1171 [Trichococcus ilyis]SEI99598.1 hypothetical protein SAMN05216375_10621 [Trichococcus ilyis]